MSYFLITVDVYQGCSHFIIDVGGVSWKGITNLLLLVLSFIITTVGCIGGVASFYHFGTYRGVVILLSLWACRECCHFIITLGVWVLLFYYHCGAYSGCCHFITTVGRIGGVFILLSLWGCIGGMLPFYDISSLSTIY